MVNNYPSYSTRAYNVFFLHGAWGRTNVFGGMQATSQADGESLPACTQAYAPCEYPAAVSECARQYH